MIILIIYVSILKIWILCPHFSVLSGLPFEPILHRTWRHAGDSGRLWRLWVMCSEQFWGYPATLQFWGRFWVMFLKLPPPVFVRQVEYDGISMISAGCQFSSCLRRWMVRDCTISSLGAARSQENMAHSAVALPWHVHLVHLPSGNHFSDLASSIRQTMANPSFSMVRVNSRCPAPRYPELHERFAEEVGQWTSCGIGVDSKTLPSRPRKVLLWMEEILNQFIGGLSMIIPNDPIILWFQLFQHVSAIQGAGVLPQVFRAPGPGTRGSFPSVRVKSTRRSTQVGPSWSLLFYLCLLICRWIIVYKCK